MWHRSHGRKCPCLLAFLLSIACACSQAPCFIGQRDTLACCFTHPHHCFLSRPLLSVLHLRPALPRCTVHVPLHPALQGISDEREVKRLRRKQSNRESAR